MTGEATRRMSDLRMTSALVAGSYRRADGRPHATPRDRGNLLRMRAGEELKEVAESRWPRFMERCPVAWPLSMGAVCTVAGTASGLYDAPWRWILLAVTALAATAALLLALAREHRREKMEEALDQRRLQAASEGESLIDGQLSPVLQLLAELVATQDPERRRQTAGEVRSAVVVAASAIVGSGNVRANLFETESDGQCMRPRLFHGRGQRSQRVFRPGDPTMDKALAGEYRFVEQVDPVQGLAYETYLTHPIYDGTRVYGVLTIDALQTGDLSKERDVNIVRVLATIAAISYAAAYMAT